MIRTKLRKVQKDTSSKVKYSLRRLRSIIEELEMMGGTVNILIKTNSSGQPSVTTHYDSSGTITFEKVKEIYRLGVDEVTQLTTREKLLWFRH
jgi:hypothetical protein